MPGLINDLGFNSLSGVLLPPQSLAASANGAGLDVGLAAHPLSLVAVLGAITGTAPTLDIRLQESDTAGGTYTDVPGGAFRQIVAADAGTMVFAYVKKSTKRFVRAAAVVAGTTPAILASMTLYAQIRNVGNPDTKGFNVSPA